MYPIIVLKTQLKPKGTPVIKSRNNPEIKPAELVEINSGMEVPEILLSKANEMMDTMLDILVGSLLRHILILLMRGENHHLPVFPIHAPQARKQ